MDDLITVEYRGIHGTLVQGTTVTVESVGAGVLKLRAAPVAVKVAAKIPLGVDAREKPPK